MQGLTFSYHLAPVMEHERDIVYRYACLDQIESMFRQLGLKEIKLDGDKVKITYRDR